MSAEQQAQSANFNRPPRIQFPDLKDEEVEIPAPPRTAEFTDTPLYLAALPMVGIGVMSVFYIFRAASGTGDNIFFALPMLLMVFVTIFGTILTQRYRRNEHERRKHQNELDYVRLLESKRVALQASHDAQHAILDTNFPTPDVLLNLALSHDNRLWERRPGDADFAMMRVGVGQVPSVITVKMTNAEVDSPLLDNALSLVDRYRLLHDAPIALPLLEDVSVGICGKRSAMMRAVRAAVCHLAVMHAPQEFHIHLITSQANRDDWRWMEWLPHTSQSQRAGSADLLAFTTENIRNLMGTLGQVIDERKERKDSKNIPFLLVIIDGPQLVESESLYSTILREGNQFGASAICLVNSFENVPSDCGAVVEVNDDGSFRYSRVGATGQEYQGRQIDELSVQDAEFVARALSSIIVREVGGAGRIPRRVDFLEMYGAKRADDLERTLQRQWSRGIPDGILPYPVRIGRESLAIDTAVKLDEKNHGPHGVLAGTTGAGKSELMQTLICALALEHDPRLVTFLLIDFKGGATFNVFNALPHTVGTVTNLDRVRVNRALEALKAETTYRQQFLDSMNVRDINQYHKYYAQLDAYRTDPKYKPLPHLFIIVDEFAQLAKEMPEFMKELVRTVQVGRSLGLHLLLGTQSPMDVITDEMNANLQFRICLRVQNIEASRAMLRRPDAAFLPSGWPGRGYFQVGEQGLFKQFQTAYVGAEYDREGIAEEKPQEEFVFEIITDAGAKVKPFEQNGAASPDQMKTALQGVLGLREPYTVARAIVDTIVDYSKSSRVPWQKPLLLPPLADTMTLTDVYAKASIGGWNGSTWAPAGKDHAGYPIALGSAPVGVLDDVFNRTQNPLWINLLPDERRGPDYKEGHVLIMGGPGTGKTNFLRTLALSQALLHPPDKLHMYFLSLSGTGLDDLGDLPHAETVIHGTESERVRRLFNRLTQTLIDRQLGKDQNSPLIMLFVDQYEQFRDSYREKFGADLDRLINDGRGVGIFVIMTALGPNSMPDRIRSLMPQRIALELGDPIEYILAVGRINSLAEGLPNGRGYYFDTPPLMCQISQPTREPAADEREISDAVKTIVGEIRAGYLASKGIAESAVTRENQQAPAPIIELPTRISLPSLVQKPGVKLRGMGHIASVIGRYDDDPLSPFVLDWYDKGPHFIVTGPPGTGKTNMLHAAVLSAAMQYSPEQMRVILVDFNGRSLRALDPLKHVIRRVTDVIELQMELVQLQNELNTFYTKVRDSDGDAALAEIPATVIVIDDYDPTSEALIMRGEILSQLRDHVRLHSDLGFYIWVAGYLERTGDPLIKQLLLRRTGFALGGRDSLQRLNVRTTHLTADVMPDGRAFFPAQNTIHTVQTAVVEDVPELVRTINNQLWPKFERATWRHPVSDARLRQQAENLVGGGKSSSSSSGGLGGFSIDIDTDGLIEDLLGNRPK